MTTTLEAQVVRGVDKKPLGFLGPTVIAVALIVLTVVAFGPALENEFVSWDDDLNFLKNRHFRGLGWPQLWWAWTTFHLGSYQPLAWMILSAQSWTWGLDPRGYHAVSILLHAGTVVALYALTVTLLRHSGWASDRAFGLNCWAGLATATYAVHPLRVEAVAWASCQPYLLSALFCVLAILAYIRACDAGPGRRKRWMNTALLLFGLSLLGKAMTVSLPAVLLILDVYPLKRLGDRPGHWFGRPVREVWLEKAGFLGLSLAASVMGYLSKVMTIVDAQTASPSFLTRVAAACYGACFYLIKTLIPRDITAYYLVPGPVSWTQPFFLASLLAVVGLSIALFLTRRRWPGLVAGWAASLVILAPVSGIVSLGTQLVASRYTYFWAMAWVPPIAAGLTLLASTRKPRWSVVLAVAGLVVIGSLVIQTRESCRAWRDSEALWTHALAHGAGQSMLVHNNLGTVYRDQGRLDRAISTYRAALQIPSEPTELTSRAFILFNLASCLEQQGKLDEAVVPLADLTRLVPQVPDVHYHLGRVLAKQGKVEEALDHYRAALRLNPDHAQARIALRAASLERFAPYVVPSRP